MSRPSTEDEGKISSIRASSSMNTLTTSDRADFVKSNKRVVELLHQFLDAKGFPDKRVLI